MSDLDVVIYSCACAKSDADAWVIALAEERGGVVVSHEQSKPGAAKPWKIPDVCAALGIEHIDLPTLIARLHRQGTEAEEPDGGDEEAWSTGGEAMVERRFKAVFQRLAENARAAEPVGCCCTWLTWEELDEIAELRRLAEEIAEPEPRSFTVT